MGFKEGESGNPLGRPKGVRNRETEMIRGFLEKLVTDNQETIKIDFESLRPIQRIRLIIDLLPYVVPKLQATSLELDLNSLPDEAIDKLYDKIMSAVTTSNDDDK